MTTTRVKRSLRPPDRGVVGKIQALGVPALSELTPWTACQPADKQLKYTFRVVTRWLGVEPLLVRRWQQTSQGS